MGLTKTARRTLVAWGCLTLGVATAAAACSSATRDFTSGDEDDGGTSSIAGANGKPDDTGGTTGSDDSGGSGSTPEGGASTRGGTASEGGAPGGGESGGSSGPGEGGGSIVGGAGGSGEEPIVSGPSVCDGATRVVPLNDAYIDNFETDARFSSWYAYSDTPVPNVPAPARSATGAVSTNYRLSLAASNIETQAEGGYGAGLGHNMINLATEKCIDLSAFDGISFWARGTSPTDKITFQLVVPASQPANSQPPGDCLANCYGHPQHVFTITDTWQRFTIAFSQLTTTPAAYDGHAMMFNFITPDTSWDISIDEVTFYEGTPPAGAVTPN